jgi:hypothetical protein
MRIATAAAALTLCVAAGALAQTSSQGTTAPPGYSPVEPLQPQPVYPAPPASPTAMTSRTYRQNYGGLTYGWSIPSGDFRSFLSNDSWINFTMEWHRLLAPNYGVGLILGWNEFYQRTIGTTDFGNGAITGDQYRHFNLFPLLVDFRFYLQKRGGTAPIPYLGGGFGGTYGVQYISVGATGASSANIAVTVAPEVGIIFNTPSTAFGLNVRWTYNFPATYLANRSFTPQYFTISLMALFSR